MQVYYAGLNHATVVLLNLSILLFAGFLVTRITKKLHLPNVSGFILAGILIGPWGLNLIAPEVMTNMDFVSDVALAFIAFRVGKFFELDLLKRSGGRVLIITLFESLLAGFFITMTLRCLFHTSWIFALIAGAIATATAPASTMMTIREYGAKGEFVDILLQVVALDDVVALVAFSAASAVARSSSGAAFALKSVLLPVALNLLAVLFGLFCGYVLSRLLRNRSRDNRLILGIAMLLGLCGVCSIFDISPLLACMAFGAAFVNIAGDEDLFLQMDAFAPPVLSCFFILSGMNLDVSALKSAGLIGLAYFIVRILGKYLGAYLGCAAVGTGKKTRDFLGVALIPQAGVSIGLALLGNRLLPPDMGRLLTTVVLTSSVLYELIGPVSAKAALFLSGAIPREEPPRKSRKWNAHNFPKVCYTISSAFSNTTFPRKKG